MANMEKPPSIACDICGGWHSTEGHQEFEIEAREKRVAEIKERPDYVYRFDTLGFKPERKEEIEPWMHGVIERAKALGDDLHDTDHFIHMEIFGPRVNDLEGERLLTIVTNGLFSEYPRHHRDYGKGIDLVRGGNLNVRPHSAGSKPSSWGIGKHVEDALILQEKFVRTRKDTDLEAYKDALKKALDKQGVKDAHLNTMRDRKKAVRILLGAKFGLIISFNRLKEKMNSEIEISSAENTYNSIIWNKNPRKELIVYPDLSRNPNLGVEYYEHSHFKCGDSCEYVPPRAHKMQSFMSFKKPNDLEHAAISRVVPEAEIEFSRRSGLAGISEETLQNLSRNILNGIYVSGGIEEQREFLKRMLEVTNNYPEERLPIYNFYGKLVWPKPN